ncbi:MAG: TolC family protein [Pyrinomonadaceae bacterium]|nr:TolC family protein [Sphingobacteriaceae bacterium]
MKRTYKILLALLLTANFAVAQSIKPASYSLQQSIETALANNQQVKQNELEVQRARINLNQVKANILPNLSANVNHGANQGRSIDPFTNAYANQNINYANYSLNGGITLFSGLITRNLIKQNSLAWQASKMDEQQAKDNLTLNVMLTYFQILNNEDQFNQAQLQAEVTRKQLERLTLLNKQGSIAPSQLSDLKGQLGNDELALINSKNGLDASRIALAQLMNVDYNRDFKVERLSPDGKLQRLESSPEQIYELAMEQLAQVKAAIFRKESAKKAIQIARGSLYPQLSLNSNLFSNYSSAARTSRMLSATDVPTTDYVESNGSRLPVITQQRSFENSTIAYNNQIRNNYSTSVGIGIRIPLLNSLRVRNQISQAKIELKGAELAEETTMLQLKQAVDLAWFNMTSADERLQVSAMQVDSFKESFKAAEVRFNAGVSTVVDYMIAKNNLDRANINLINARYEFVLRARIIDYYRGKLTL